MTQELKEKFNEYDRNNPKIYKAFSDMALDMSRRRGLCGAKCIMEVIRWNTMLSGDDDYKINNNYAAYYARKFERDNPSLTDLFAKRAV